MSTGPRPRVSSRRSTFVVRLDCDDKGNISGVIERVRTGAKEAFRGVDAISPSIARMVEAEDRGAAEPASFRRSRGRGRPGPAGGDA